MLTASDELLCEVTGAIRRQVREACNDAEMQSLCGDSGEASPYAELRESMKEIIKEAERTYRELLFLQAHKCEYNDYDYCVHCSRDGRA